MRVGDVEDMQRLFQGIILEWDEDTRIPRITTLRMTIKFPQNFEPNPEKVRM